MSDSACKTKNLLLRNCFCIATGTEKADLTGTDILLRDRRIASLGANLKAPPEEETRTLDCSACLVVPGFVNTHHHFYQTLTRALPAVQNAGLFAWLKYLYEIWKNIDAEAVEVSSLLAMGELLKTGCTCSTDHHYLYPRGFKGDLTGIQFEAARRLGLRFSPCRGSMSLGRKDGGLPPDSVVQSEAEILSDCRRVLETYHDTDELSMSRIILAPCSPFSVTLDLMRETAELARSYGARLHTHLAETRDEDDFCSKHYGKRPLALMQECDFLGKDVFYAHGIHFNDQELEILAETQTGVAHCPSSNMRLGSGIARIKEMLKLKIPVGLAVDGSASNDSSDFVAEMRQALLLQRIRYGPDALTAREVLTMASRQGAELLGFPALGRIAVNAAADLAVFRLDGLEYAGALADPAAALLFCGGSHRAAYTIVNGRLTVEEGRLTGLDEAELAARANSIAARLLGQQ
jgi:8-oxoguanine deaminase